jgi:hypothetical protein
MTLNNVDLESNSDIYVLPTQSQSKEIISGNILLSFIVFVCSSKVDIFIKYSGYSIRSVVKCLQNYHAHVIKNKIIPDMKTHKVNNLLEALNINIPAKITIASA